MLLSETWKKTQRLLPNVTTTSHFLQISIYQKIFLDVSSLLGRHCVICYSCGDFSSCCCWIVISCCNSYFSLQLHEILNPIPNAVGCGVCWFFLFCLFVVVFPHLIPGACRSSLRANNFVCVRLSWEGNSHCKMAW